MALVLEYVQVAPKLVKSPVRDVVSDEKWPDEPWTSDDVPFAPSLCVTTKASQNACRMSSHFIQQWRFKDCQDWDSAPKRIRRPMIMKGRNPFMKTKWLGMLALGLSAVVGAQ